MEFPGKKLLKLLVERDPASSEFRSEVRAALRPTELPSNEGLHNDNMNSGEEFALWHDVFVEQELPWRRFLQSAVLHGAAIALIWTISVSWLRQQKILDRVAFDRSALVTYTPQDY